jgi:phosphoserine aminotransferase
MTRAFNFSAGPAALPTEVLARARDELLDYRGKGLSVMEMSHRSPEFIEIAERAERDFRDLLGVPKHYKVLFLQGGATSQFSMIPLNLAKADDVVDYIDTGSWSDKAIAEARRYCKVNVAASSKARNYDHIPDVSEWKRSPNAAYLHLCGNETIGGVEFHEYPDTGTVPLVADMSSTLLSRPLDVTKFALIYSGAQKNIGPAGITVVVIREDLIGRARKETPIMLDYAPHAKNDSMYNTPPTYAWYIAGLVFEWLKGIGGLVAMAKINERKAKKLYAAIDASNFYHCPIEPRDRSWMNVPFKLSDPRLDDEFVARAEEARLLTLKGHRSVGGMRASLYNAVPEAAVDALIEFMRDFESHHA